MKIIDYDDWLRRGPRMSQRAKFILLQKLSNERVRGGNHLRNGSEEECVPPL